MKSHRLQDLLKNCNQFKHLMATLFSLNVKSRELQDHKSRGSDRLKSFYHLKTSKCTMTTTMLLLW